MRNRILGLAILSSLVLLRPAASSAVKYKVDSAHTAVTFQVRHLFSKVNGRFDKFDGTIDFDPARPKRPRSRAASTRQHQHQRGEARHASAFEGLLPRREVPEDHLRQHRGVGRRQSEEDRQAARQPHHPRRREADRARRCLPRRRQGSLGQCKAGFTAKTTINRKDYGLTWNETLETGGVLVGDDIEIEIDAEGQRRPN